MATSESAAAAAHAIPMTSGEAGAILGVSARTVQRLTESGDLPYLRKLPGPKGDWLYIPADVHNLAAKRGLKVTAAEPEAP
jgi:excisionase family DNA binding protein